MTKLARLLSNDFVWFGVILALVIASARTGPVSAAGGVVDLSTYVPGNVGLQTWFYGQHTCTPAIRWESSNAPMADGSDWFRWDFSAVPSEYFDIMYWSAAPDSKLRYLETRTACTDWGAQCAGDTAFPDSIVYAPRFFNTLGGPVSGSGSSRVTSTAPPPLTGTCVGVDTYKWTVSTYKPAGAVWPDPQVDATEPVIYVHNEQSATWKSGPCGGTNAWEEHWFLGRVCDDNNVCGRTIISSWGGQKPYAPDKGHWAMHFDLFTRKP